MQKGGFFNSTDHDRRYSALDFNQLIDTIKSDGIDQYGDKLEVIAGEGLNVIVKSGKAFYNQHWLFNDANLTLELEQASPTQDRIDAIIIEVNETDRTMLIKSVTGEPSDTPVAPALVNTTNIHQYYLAWVEVATGSLVVGTITDKRTQWADIESPRVDRLTERVANNESNQATVESSTTASRSYVVGDYLVLGELLYQVSANISQGDALVVGTNIVQTTIGNELSTLANAGGASVNTIVLSASNWSNGVYDLESIYPQNLYDIQITPCTLTTSAQLKAWSIARPIGSASANTITCLGTTPTIDITVMVVATKKGGS